MHTYGVASAWITMAGGIGWAVLGGFAVAGRLRPPRAWAKASARRWGWCQVLFGVGTACYPADALLGNTSATTLSCAGGVLTIVALVLLLTSGDRRSGLEQPPPDDTPTQPFLPWPGAGNVSPQAPTQPRLHRP